MLLRGLLVVTLIKLVDRIPMPPPEKRGRGRPRIYSDRLFLKALLVMIVRHLYRVHELLSVLEEPTGEMQAIGEFPKENGRFPCRRTWERRLKGMPETLPTQVGCLGRYLVAFIRPWENCGAAVAIDSTPLAAKGGVWHKKHREQGVVPDTRIDTDAHWTKSGWHGWVYGWKLHLVAAVAAVWIPLAAELAPANVADNEVALDLIRGFPDEVRYLLGDVYSPHSRGTAGRARYRWPCPSAAPASQPPPTTESSAVPGAGLHAPCESERAG